MQRRYRLKNNANKFVITSKKHISKKVVEVATDLTKIIFERQIIIKDKNVNSYCITESMTS